MFEPKIINTCGAELENDVNVNKLLDTNRKQINLLKDMVSDLDTSVSHGLLYDDIFYLRYILSRKTAEAAHEKCRKCIQYRTENAEWLDSLKVPHMYEVVQKYMKYGAHKFTKSGDVILIARLGISNEAALFDNITPDQFYQYMIDTNELGYRLLDHYTRTTRRLTKMYFIGDYTNNKFQISSKSRAIASVQGRASNFSDYMYPQLIRKTVIINLPTIILAFWNMVKIFFSKKMVEKLAIIHATSIADHNLIKEAISINDIPTFWGGNCNCENGCIDKTPNCTENINVYPNEDGVYSVNVGSRRKSSVTKFVKAGDTINFEAVVAGYTIPVTAKVVPKGGRIEDAIELSSSETIDSSTSGLKKNWVIKQSGTLLVEFDNSSSYLRSKRVSMKLNHIASTSSSPKNVSTVHSELVEVLDETKNNSELTA